jgi:hypothetical protein
MLSHIPEALEAPSVGFKVPNCGRTDEVGISIQKKLKNVKKILKFHFPHNLKQTYMPGWKFSPTSPNLQRTPIARSVGQR